MTRKWTYILAALLMGLIAVIVLAAVHIPAQQRQMVAERQAHAEMFEVAMRVLPSTMTAAAVEASLDEVDSLPVSVDGQPVASGSLTALKLTVVADEAAQAAMRQSVLDGLHGVEGDYGYVNQDGQEYLVEARSEQAGFIVRIYQAPQN